MLDILFVFIRQRLFCIDEIQTPYRLNGYNSTDFYIKQETVLFRQSLKETLFKPFKY